MLKKLGILILIILLIITGILFARNAIIKAVLPKGLELATGLSLEIEHIDIGLFKTFIDIKNTKLINPVGFPDRVMVDLGELYMDYKLGAFLKKKVDIQELRIDLREFLVVKNEEGELNITSIKGLGAKKPESKKVKPQEKKQPLPIQIDLLKLKIGRAVYKDYSKGSPPQVTEYKINIDETFTDINDPAVLIQTIIGKALVNTTIAKLAGFDLKALTGSASQLIKGTAETATKTIEGSIEATKDVAEGMVDALKKTGEGFKDILPFGGRE